MIVGDKDWICPMSEWQLGERCHDSCRNYLLTESTANSELIASRVPDAKLFVVENANHSVHLEKNEDVLRRIRAHLTE